MRAHRIVYHIIVLISWFWVEIVRSPRSSNVNLECRHLSSLFHQQRMLFFKFYLHFGHILHFFGVLVLSQVSSIYWNMTTSKFDQKILLPSWFLHVLIWLGIFRGMRSSNVNLECRHWFCDLYEGCHFLGFLPKVLTVYKHFWAHRHIFQCIFQSFYIYILYIYGNYI